MASLSVHSEMQWRILFMLKLCDNITRSAQVNSELISARICYTPMRLIGGAARAWLSVELDGARDR